MDFNFIEKFIYYAFDLKLFSPDGRGLCPRSDALET